MSIIGTPWVGRIPTLPQKVGTFSLAREESLERELKVDLHKAWKRDDLSVVVFLQESQGRRILGANSLRWSQ